MTTSFRAIVESMDSVDTPSLRTLFTRHRWFTPSRNPPQPLSLRALAGRHTDQTKVVRFLWYNTFLLHGWRLSISDKMLLKLVLAFANLTEIQALEQAGISPESILSACGYDTAEKIAGLFGVDEDDFKEVADFFLTGGLSAFTDISVIDMIEKLQLTVEKVVMKITELSMETIDVIALFWGAIRPVVEAIIGEDIPDEFAFAAKPQLDIRAVEIGRTIAQDYNVVALCEVFSPERRSRLSAAAGEVTPSNVLRGNASGPSVGDDPMVFADSGLQTLTFGARITNTVSRAFETKGDNKRDADAWSNKGVLLTVVDVGFGKLEIYSTHLISGGDLLCTMVEDVPLLNQVFPPLSDEQRIKIQLAQLEEVKAFYRQHHVKSNIALIVGDLNINAHDNQRNEYRRLVSSLKEIGMLDLWPYYRYRENPGVADLKRVPRGDTHASGNNNLNSELNRICVPDGKYADEHAAVQDPTNRIDYIFVQEPNSDHTFTLDLGRIRRRPFQRPAGSSGQQYLSDHVGLDVTLFCNP